MKGYALDKHIFDTKDTQGFANDIYIKIQGYIKKTM